MATDTSTLNYVVTAFDQQNMVMFVSFPDDGTTANIGIGSLPATQDDLDTLVKPYATHLEIADTIANTKSSDLTFLKSVVGKKKSTTRFSQVESAKRITDAIAATAATQAPAADLSSNEITIGATPEQVASIQANNKSADVEYIKGLIAEVLTAQTTKAAS